MTPACFRSKWIQIVFERDTLYCNVCQIIIVCMVVSTDKERHFKLEKIFFINFLIIGVLPFRSRGMAIGKPQNDRMPVHLNGIAIEHRKSNGTTTARFARTNTEEERERDRAHTTAESLGHLKNGSAKPHRGNALPPLFVVW